MDSVRRSFQVAAQAGKALRCLTVARQIATALCIGAAVFGLIKTLAELYSTTRKA